MKPLAYALFLLGVLVASVILLRSIEPERDAITPEPRRRTPVISSRAPQATEIDRDQLDGASAEDLYHVGDELLSLWHVREATEVFEQAVATDSTFYPALVKLVECYTDPLVCREDPARATWAVARLHLPAPEDSFFLSGMRNLYVDRDYTAAIGDLTTAKRLEVSHPDTPYYLALAYFLSGRLDDADRQLEDLLNQDDTEGRVVELSARSAAAAGDYATASERARVLAQAYSEEPFPYVLLAQVEFARGHHEIALQFCNNALQLDPKFIPAILTRANLYVGSEDLDAARVSFEKLLLFDDPILRSIGDEGIGFVDFLHGDFDEGLAAMDEAIRNAILAGSVRKGLSYAAKLVDYLCQLGQADAAAGVVERWVSGFGDIPVSLGRLRIDILNGDLERARKSLVQMKASKDWLIWSRVLSLDYTELNALTQIGEKEHEKALDMLGDGDKSATGVAAGVNARRSFLKGYASFESGNAEAAAVAFADVRTKFFGVEFPYRGDPVLYVQSLFLLAESELARGNKVEARRNYEAFLASWGETSWDLLAVQRARQKLEGLVETPAAP